jgi:23S rRNA pseudouridine2604 synthase
MPGYALDVRLNKFISERREADGWIETGRVTINGERAAVGAVVNEGDVVAVDGKEITAKDKPRPVYIALNKPVGVICTTERGVEGNIVDFVDHAERIFPIGRLDKESEGLILLTNDGDIVNEVLRVENEHEKEYVVAVDRSVTPEFLSAMSRGMKLDVGYARPCKTSAVAARVFRIVLTQGLNRQIRKMCEALGYEVVALQRVRFLHIELGHLKPGRWRNLTDAEVAGLHATMSAKPAPAKQAPQPQKPKQKPRPAAIPFGQPGGVGGPPLGRGRGSGRRGR